MSSKGVSSTILKVFSMTQPGIEPTSPGPLANTLPTRPMSRCTKEIRRIGIFLLCFTFIIFNLFKVNFLNKVFKGVHVIMLYFGLRPSQKCHSKVMHRKVVTHSNVSYERKSRGRKLADEMGRGKKKFPWYTHRLMHRKRVTCELTAWQLFPLDDDQTCDFKDRVGDWVCVELLYNSVKTEVKLVAVRDRTEL